MKARLFDRIVLRTYLVFNLIGAAVYGVYLLGWLEFVEDLKVEIYNGIVLGLLIYFGVWAVWTVYLLFAPDKKPPSAVVLTDENNAKTRVTIAALEQIARTYALSFSQVQSARFNFYPIKNKGIALNIRAAFYEGTVLPDVIATLRAGTVEHMRNHTGLNLVAVSVTVEPCKEEKAAVARVR